MPQTLTVSRTQTQGLPRQVVEAALRADLGKGAVVEGVDLGEQGFAALKVLKTVAREDEGPRCSDRATPYVRRVACRDAETAAYYETLKKRFKVELKAAKAEPGDDAASAALAN